MKRRYYKIQWCKRQINEFKEELARKLAKDLDKKLEILSNELRNMSEDHEVFFNDLF